MTQQERIKQPLAGVTFFVLDDHPIMLEMLSAAVAASGGTLVGTARSVSEAIATLSSCAAPTVALIDGEVGVQRGQEVALWMREQPHLANTLRVASSATNSGVFNELVDGDVFHGYLDKRIGMDRDVAEKFVQPLLTLLYQEPANLLAAERRAHERAAAYNARLRAEGRWHNPLMSDPNDPIHPAPPREPIPLWFWLVIMGCFVGVAVAFINFIGHMP